MKKNRNNPNNSFKSGDQSNQRPLKDFNNMETNTDILKENKNELPGLNTDNLQQKLLTTFTNNKSSSIVDIEEAVTETTRKENY